MIYLDNASTSFPKPKEVSWEIHEYLTNYGVSPGRGSYHLAEQADAVVHAARAMLAELLGAPSANSIVFTNNATHSLNLAIKGTLKSGDHVLICSYSHNSTIRPVDMLKRTLDVTYDVIDVSPEGHISLEQVQSKIQPNTRLACFTHASNVIGVISKYELAAQLCQSKNIPVLLDCTQSLGYCPISIENMPIDFLAGTGHKTLLGPSGIGFLYVRHHKRLNTICEGGSGGNHSLSLFHPSQMPHKFEAGTLNTTGIAGLKGALEYIRRVTFDAMKEKSMDLTMYAWEMLSQLDKVTLYGTSDRSSKVPIISFTIAGLLPSEVAHHYDEQGICIRSGTQCAPLVHQTLNTLPTGTLRIGIGHYNTCEDIDAFLKSTQNIIQESKHAKIDTRFDPGNHARNGTTG